MTTATTNRTARAAKPAKAAKMPQTLSDAQDPGIARLRALAPYRFLIENVEPEINGGRYPVKREAGDRIEVWADIVCDGHGVTAAAIRYRRQGEGDWHTTPMRHYDNDRWTGGFRVEQIGRFEYTIEAWVDEFETWRRDLVKKANAGQDIDSDLVEGRALVEATRDGADGDDRATLENILRELDGIEDAPTRMDLLMSERLDAVMRRRAPRVGLTAYRTLEVVVDRLSARFTAWYEMFWRSQGTDASRGASIDECIARLPYIRDMGFDVVYIVPHHPIGRTNRKGKNNSLVAGPHDPGSPYAIGDAGVGEHGGGHKDVNPEWGSLADFRRFVAATHEHGMEVAIDFAIQCSPDHPWIKDHPDWFRWRNDGTIRFAENPPKKYEDIVNVEFYRPHGGPPIEPLWLELRDVVLFWAAQGVKVFRVDNPHTKPLPFWEWMIGEVQRDHPDAIFLSEAFTRPKVMKGLAKHGFTQSYSYFTWRNAKQELTEYLEELTQGPTREYMRANFFANTPDILPVILQTGGRSAFMSRVVLAATLSSAYGIYNGFELCEGTPIPGKEEYLNSEKYEYKVWDWDRPGNIRDWITKLNAARRSNPALQEYDNLRFYRADNDKIIVYGKHAPQAGNFVLIAVNLDPHNAHETYFDLPLWELGLPDWGTVRLEELISGYTFSWTGTRQHVWIDHQLPAFIWRVTPA